MEEEIDYKTAYETAMIGFKMQMQEIERLNKIIKTKDEGIKALTEELCDTTKEKERLNNKVEELMTLYTTEREVKEDKKIEKITMRAGLVGSIDNKLENLDINIMAVEDKINEIIDYINDKGE